MISCHHQQSKGVTFFMKRIKEKDFKVVKAETLEEFGEKMHYALQGLDDPEIIYPPGFQLTAYISWTTEKTIYTSSFERAKYECGVKCFCGDCPHFVRNPDRRRKIHNCGRSGEEKRSDSPACQQMIDQFLDGKIDWTQTIDNRGFYTTYREEA